MSDNDITVLPDGSAFTVLNFELPKTHWIYGDKNCENDHNFEPPPMPMRMGTDDLKREEMAEMLRKAARYAVRSVTLNGEVTDFDPDALVQNMVTGFLGYHTPDGLSDDDWANPPQ